MWLVHSFCSTTAATNLIGTFNSASETICLPIAFHNVIKAQKTIKISLKKAMELKNPTTSRLAYNYKNEIL
jgi:hypothetical protein